MDRAKPCFIMFPARYRGRSARGSAVDRKYRPSGSAHAVVAKLANAPGLEPGGSPW